MRRTRAVWWCVVALGACVADPDPGGAPPDAAGPAADGEGPRADAGPPRPDAASAPPDAAPLPADVEPAPPEAGAPPVDAAPVPLACPEPPRELEACFRGEAHADCGGEGEPALLCRAEDPEDCLWFDRGCGPAGWQRCEDPQWCRPVSIFAGWGARPWARERAMDLSLSLDLAAEGGETSLACDACVGVGEPEDVAQWGERCFNHLSLCDPPDVEEGEQAYAFRLPRPDRPDRGLPGLVTLGIGRASDLGSRFVFLELDFERGRGRACIVRSSDTSLLEVEPDCADTGEVVVDRVPALVEDIVLMRGRFDAVFPPLRPYRDSDLRVEGLRLTGTF